MLRMPRNDDKQKKGRIIDPALCFIAVRKSLRRLHQAFLGQRFLHLRARADAGLVGHQVRQSRERSNFIRSAQDSIVNR